MITDVNVIKINREIDILPHVMIASNMILKILSSVLKLMTCQAAYEADTLLVLLRAKLWGKNNMIQCMQIHAQA